MPMICYLVCCRLVCCLALLSGPLAAFWLADWLPGWPEALSCNRFASWLAGLACVTARAGTLMPRADGRHAIGANCNHHLCRSESDRHGLVVTIWFDHIFVAGVSKACPRRVRVICLEASHGRLGFGVVSVGVRRRVGGICQDALHGMLCFGVVSVGVRGVSISVSV